jgi:TonB family protein
MFNADPLNRNQVQALRYEEATGFFHYVIPCQQSIEATRRVPAICWPINATRIYENDGKLAHTEAIQGTLAVTETQLSFLPAEQSDLSFARAIPLTQAKFMHRPGESSGRIETPEYTIQFSFLNTCVGNCPTVRGLPNLNKTSQLDQEFKNVSDSLTQFNATYKRFHEQALNLRVAVDSANQPTLEDVKPSMMLYSALNKGLADACAEPAKSCIQSFQSYQTCMSTKSSAECGPPPSCRAACTLPPDVYRHIAGGACVSVLRDSVSIYPDWVPTLKENAGKDTFHMPVVRATGGFVGSYPVLSYGWLSLSGIPDHIQSFPDFPGPQSDGRCSVKAVYLFASDSYAARVPIPALASPPPSTSSNISNNVQGQVRVATGVMAGLLLSAPPPVYPPNLKAAHISGTVVLAARISKTGTVEDLNLISGPPMLVTSAMDAVRQWKYKPYLLNGVPCDVLTAIYVNFGLDDPPAKTAQPVDSQKPN